jgi:NDP-sugar pyrophosphorylase family protein
MSSNNTATLAVQDHGPALRLAIDGYHITDIHGKISGQPSTHQFTGVYVVDPEILDLIPEGEKISIIPAFLELIRRGELGAYHVKGHPGWIDLGTRETYLEASLGASPEISPEATVAATASVTNSWVGPGCQIGDRAKITDSILWPGTIISDDAELTKCIVHSKSPAAGVHLDTDL